MLFRSSDTKYALGFYNTIFEKYTKSKVDTPTDPLNQTINSCIHLLKSTNNSYSIEDLIKLTCQNDEYICNYILGDLKNINNPKKLKVENNRKIRKIYDALRSMNEIQIVNCKPMIFKYKDKDDINLRMSDMSDMSDNFRIHLTLDHP